MTSIYRGKMCVHFSELLLLKCNENALKNITQNKIKSHFFSWKVLFLFCYTAQKMKFSIKDLFGKCGQSRSFLRIWSHLLKKCLMENFIFLCSTMFVKKFHHGSWQWSFDVRISDIFEKKLYPRSLKIS